MTTLPRAQHEALLEKVRDDLREAMAAHDFAKEMHEREPSRITEIGLLYTSRQLDEAVAAAEEWVA